MKNSKTRTIPYRRKREGKTNYKKRLNLLKSALPRLVVRKSLTGMTAQIVKYQPIGDNVLVSANSRELAKYGWKTACSNTPAAYLVGFLLAQKAKKAKITEVVVDAGLYKPIRGSKIYAVIKGAVDNGLEMPHDEDVMPSEERIKGKHIEDYAKSMEGGSETYKKQFSRYIKEGADPKNISKAFKDTLSKIKGA